jgi:hypothetical protein
MDLKELTDLINVRQYVSSAINNFRIDKPTVGELNGILLLLDKKIINVIKGEKFKKYIGYSDVKKVIEEAVNANNIRSGLKNH